MSTQETSDFRFPVLASVAAFALLLTSGSLLAAPPADGTRSVTVDYADLDVSRPAGARALYVRIKRAARTVCAPLESRDLHRVALWRDCYEQAVADAVAEIGRPTLTALHSTSRSPAG